MRVSQKNPIRKISSTSPVFTIISSHTLAILETSVLIVTLFINALIMASNKQMLVFTVEPDMIDTS